MASIVNGELDALPHAAILLLDVGDTTHDVYLGVLRHLHHPGEGENGSLPQADTNISQGVIGEVQPDDVGFTLQLLHEGELRGSHEINLHDIHLIALASPGEHVEEALPLLGLGLSLGEHGGDVIHHATAGNIEAVKGSGQGQVLVHAAVGDAQGHAAVHHVLHGGVGAVLPALLDDYGGNILGHCIHAGEAVENVKATLSGEVRRHQNVGEVDVHGTHLDTHGAGFLQEG